ncbi:hypothetical protein [Mesorhizobium sp. WSM4310]|uniref:hypothetical protein n=1 Tax=Mesorhizobium sp. WSM4310 TaxID=2589883 RepID=UPI001AEE444D|nr:hypothetical protein [Mesorhizobium sp. WSM4310]
MATFRSGHEGRNESAVSARQRADSVAVVWNKRGKASSSVVVARFVGPYARNARPGEDQIGMLLMNRSYPRTVFECVDRNSKACSGGGGAQILDRRRLNAKDVVFNCFDFRKRREAI